MVKINLWRNKQYLYRLPFKSYESRKPKKDLVIFAAKKDVKFSLDLLIIKTEIFVDHV